MDTQTKSSWLERARHLGLYKQGNFTLKSGKQSNSYWDLRALISHPDFWQHSVDLLQERIQERQWHFDRVVAVPYGALGLALALAYQMGKPALIPRTDTKKHGLGGDIVGHYQDNEEILLVEDVLTTGGSLLKVRERLQAKGLIANKAVCLVIRDSEAEQNLQQAGVDWVSLCSLAEDSNNTKA